MTLNAVLERIDAELPESLDRLMALLRIPSISTDPAFKGDCARAADWLVAELQSLGFEASARPTPGHPMVVAHGGEGDGRHLLFYGHYDVQPVDPLSLWHRDPFDPAIEDGPRGKLIRGRGASDDKGQLMTFVEACRAWKAVNGSLPGKLTIFLEGEEESGSPSLIPFLKRECRRAEGRPGADLRHRALRRHDPGDHHDAARAAGRGTHHSRAANRDLHSGAYGGAAINPIRVLARILGGLHDENGRVTVPGFYDDVDELPDAIRAQWQRAEFRCGGIPRQRGSVRARG